MSKHLVDIDEDALRAAQAELRTATIRETVNEALRRATTGRDQRVRKALDTLTRVRVRDRNEAWR
jgi:Arc/MetJ family transcription regulator